MTNALRNTVKLKSPCDVLAAIPHLLGFRPGDSLVLISLQGRQESLRVGVAVRVDLPVSEDRCRLAEYLSTGPLASDGTDSVMLAVVGGAEPDSEVPPHRQLIDVLRSTFADAGIPVVHASWTRQIREGEPWYCYDEDGCRGVLSDPKCSFLGAAMTAAGAVTFDSREELQELIAPEDAESLARRTARLDAMLDEAGEERSGPGGTERDLAVVMGAVHRTARGAALTEEDCLRLLIALSDGRVRDVALSTALGEFAGAAEQLWITLVKKAPEPEVADVAALLAFSAYVRGNGALAGMALERIEATRPEHTLGCLLRQALDAGVPPADLAVIAEDAVEDAKMLIEEDGAW